MDSPRRRSDCGAGNHRDRVARSQHRPHGDVRVATSAAIQKSRHRATSARRCLPTTSSRRSNRELKRPTRPAPALQTQGNQVTPALPHSCFVALATRRDTPPPPPPPPPPLAAPPRLAFPPPA